MLSFEAGEACENIIVTHVRRFLKILFKKCFRIIGRESTVQPEYTIFTSELCKILTLRYSNENQFRTAQLHNFKVVSFK